MAKVGIVTVYTGFNYGSSLQAYATKIILKNMGYEAVLLGQSGSIVQGRDIRVKKIIDIGMRVLAHPSTYKKIKSFQTSPSAAATEKTKELFNMFTDVYLNPQVKKWSELKRLAKRDDYVAFLCGSDQIWNADALYVDPFYYLRFAPVAKRIAFSPSFGRERIPTYNKRVIAKYLEEIPILSVREKSGVRIINDLVNKKSVCLLDPTIIISKDEWVDTLNIVRGRNDYILAYFLNRPSDRAVECIKAIAKDTNRKVIALPYRNIHEEWFDEAVIAGPFDFVELVANSAFILTDSFHGVAFSINFQIPFYVFERQYGAASNQSERIHSLLEIVSLEDRFEPITQDFNAPINFTSLEQRLEKERQTAKEYLYESIGKVIYGS